MDDNISRSEHSKDVEGIHQRINKTEDSINRVELSVAKIESSANHMHETWTRVHDELYNKDGLKDRTLCNTTHRNIQWAILFLIVSGIVGRAIWVIVNIQ